MEFQLIIPCYNEAASLRAMVEKSVAAAKASGFAPGGFGLVVVDNGSTDGTKAALAELQDYAGWFSVVTVEKNRGYGDGIWQGLMASEAAFVGWTHADEQCEPADAFNALAKLGGRKRVVVKGERRQRGWFDWCWSRGFEGFVFLLLGVRLYEVNAQPKVFHRDLLGEVAAPPVDFSFDLFVLLCAKKAGWAMETIPVVFGARAHGQSRWAFSFRSRMRTGWRMLKVIYGLRSRF